MLYFIIYLKAIAAALIANSHFKSVYPTDLISFGGGFGLALFYMISGFLMTDIGPKFSFGKWYLKKLVRLYIPLWILRLFEILIGQLKISSIKEFLWHFVFPTYWFVSSILILYVLYFIFMKYIFARFELKAIYIFSALLLLAFAGLYISKFRLGSFSLETLQFHEFSLETPYFIMQLIWLLCMLAGIYLKKAKKKPRKKTEYLAVTFFSVILFMLVKLTVQRNIFLQMQFLLAASYILFAYALFCFFMNIEDTCKQYAEKSPGKLATMISCSSLEIYYIQFIWINCLKHIVFPVNLILLCACIVTSGFILHEAAGWLIDRIRRL